MRLPEPGQMPLAKPKSSLLAYDADKEKEGSDHFFNPLSRMHNNSTISKRFEPGEVNALKQNSKVKVKKVKTTEEGLPRASTRVRSSFFAIFAGKRKNQPGAATVKTAKRKKPTFFQRLFGFRRKKRRSRYRDDIVHIKKEEKGESLDISFNNEPIDPRQHMRNTQNFMMSRVDTLNGEDLDSTEAEPTEFIQESKPSRDVNSVDLFAVDKARQSYKHDSMWDQAGTVTEQPSAPLAPNRRDMISFVGSGKVKELEPAGRTTLIATTIPRSKKSRGTSHLFLSKTSELEESSPVPLMRAPTLKGEDLPKTPMPEKHKSSSTSIKKVEEKQEEGSVLTSTSFKRKVSRNNSVLSSRNIEQSIRSQPQKSVASEERKSENLVVPKKSGIWSVDERVVSVLASAATLKRKKKKSANRYSPERIHSVTKTEASVQQEDNDLLGILASPRTAARKKGSFSSFQSFEANL